MNSRKRLNSEGKIKVSHRILLINHYAGSPEYGLEYRPYYFGREWVRAGHRVLIVAADFSHIRHVNPSFTETVMREIREGVEYLWVKTPPYQKNDFGRVRNMATFIFRLWGACASPIADFRPDLVIASSTYTWDNWIAARYARFFGAKYVYEVHDLWPLTPMELMGMSRWHPFIWSLQQAENFACRQADKVVSLLPAAKTHLMTHGMLSERFVYIPNGIVKEEWQDPQKVPDGHLTALSEIRSKVRCLVGYVGGHGLANSLDVLVEAGAETRLKDIGIICVGDGSEKNRLKKKAQVLGSSVRFLDPIPKRAVPSLLGLFDVLYIGQSGSPLYRFGISSNKLFEYMMAGIPILHFGEADNNPVQEVGCGLSIPPTDVSGLCEGVLKLAALSAEERSAMGNRGRDHVKTHYQISILSQRFLDSIWE